MNGYRFHVECNDNEFNTQNCKVPVTIDIGFEMKNIDCYGILIEIIELQYLGGKRVVLFLCKWFDVPHNEMEPKSMSMVSLVLIVIIW